jgi:hypothetical protein
MESRSPLCYMCTSMSFIRSGEEAFVGILDGATVINTQLILC